MGDYLGVAFLLLAGIGFCILIVAVVSKDRTSRLGKIVNDCLGVPPFMAEAEQQRNERVEADYRAAIAEPDRDEVVRTAKVGDFIEVMGRPMRYVCRILALELQFFGENKSDKRHVDPQSGSRLREFPVIVLSGDRLLFEQPMGEGLPLSWFLYEHRSDDMKPGFTEYLKGTKENPGPIMMFADSNQQADVTFNALQKTWQARDIVWADMKTQAGKAFVRNDSSGNMPRVVMVLGRNVEDDQEWILFIDLRSGDGSDTLWVGRKFNPQAEVDA